MVDDRYQPILQLSDLIRDPDDPINSNIKEIWDNAYLRAVSIPWSSNVALNNYLCFEFLKELRIIEDIRAFMKKSPSSEQNVEDYQPASMAGSSTGSASGNNSVSMVTTASINNNASMTTAASASSSSYPSSSLTNQRSKMGSHTSYPLFVGNSSHSARQPTAPSNNMATSSSSSWQRGMTLMPFESDPLISNPAPVPTSSHATSSVNASEDMLVRGRRMAQQYDRVPRERNNSTASTAGSNGVAAVCYCGRTFSRQRDLTRHINTRHSAVKNIHCEACEAPFARLDTLRRHKQSLTACPNNIRRRRNATRDQD